MSEKAFTSKDMLQRLSQVPELAYEFSSEEVLGASTKFLQYVGYQLQPPSPMGSVQPDFHVKRHVESTTYEIVGLVGHSLNEMTDLFAKLIAMKSILGEKADYVIVLPPISERRLLDFLFDNKGKWYLDLKQEQFMLWLCNPKQETMWCIMGSPNDTLFSDYFIMSKLSLDSILGTRISQDLMEDE
ncbi:MAG: hypothetical protein SU899_00520 [Chloroflexota bacterium]|nr:hypothetical protein [Chloroflexota bacterium]